MPEFGEKSPVGEDNLQSRYQTLEKFNQKKKSTHKWINEQEQYLSPQPERKNPDLYFMLNIENDILDKELKISSAKPAPAGLGEIIGIRCIQNKSGQTHFDNPVIKQRIRDNTYQHKRLKKTILPRYTDKYEKTI